MDKVILQARIYLDIAKTEAVMYYYLIEYRFLQYRRQAIVHLASSPIPLIANNAGVIVKALLYVAAMFVFLTFLLKPLTSLFIFAVYLPFKIVYFLLSVMVYIISSICSLLCCCCWRSSRDTNTSNKPVKKSSSKPKKKRSVQKDTLKVVKSSNSHGAIVTNNDIVNDMSEPSSDDEDILSKYKAVKAKGKKRN